MELFEKEKKRKEEKGNARECNASIRTNRDSVSTQPKLLVITQGNGFLYDLRERPEEVWDVGVLSSFVPISYKKKGDKKYQRESGGVRTLKPEGVRARGEMSYGNSSEWVDR
jgi:hypothetical protein